MTNKKESFLFHYIYLRQKKEFFILKTIYLRKAFQNNRNTLHIYNTTC